MSLLKFNKEEKRFKSYTEKDGLANNIVYQILKDEDENKNLDMRDMMQFDSKILMYLGVGIALGALGVYLLRR